MNTVIANEVDNEVINTHQKWTQKNAVYQTRQLNLWYGENHALKNINLDIMENEVTSIIGPSGCGKSTYIKTLN